MKISKIENRIRKGYFSEQLFADFQTALKRVPKKTRCQYCYTNAYYLKDKRPKDGIRLIQFGLDTYESDWLDKMRAYLNLGGIYESCKDYTSAKAAYEKAVTAVPEEAKSDYLPSLSINLLRAELHCNRFGYSDYLYGLYQTVLRADEFEATFRSFIFYRSIAEIIIAKKNQNRAKHITAYRTAMVALDGESVTGMDLLLGRHKYKNDAHATKQAIAFLRKNAIQQK